MSDTNVCLCVPGRTAHLISAYRPRVPIITITRNGMAARQCHLYRGVFPIHYLGKSYCCSSIVFEYPQFIGNTEFGFAEARDNDWTEDMDQRIHKGISVGTQRGFVKPGEPISASLLCCIHTSTFTQLMMMSFCRRPGGHRHWMEGRCRLHQHCAHCDDPTAG